jgi:DNA-binding NtrC family response regulator
MKFSTRIMIVDDEMMICESLQAWFVRDGYQVDTALSGEAALKSAEDCPADIYLVDIKMPGMDGIQFLSRIKEIQPSAVVVMMTAHGTVQTAVEAMKRGATDYFCKPFDPDELSLFIERLLSTKVHREENVVSRELLGEDIKDGYDVFIAQSASMRAILAKIEEIAPSSAPILITGETGVGKDMVARAIHFRSDRSCGPFIAVNCGSLAESLLESELFGHEKGAFTGAVQARRGRLEMANNGTLFLDEVGEISPKMQVSLLRALEEKSFVRLGGSKPTGSDFRLITATHRDLPSLIKENQFRDDFYYRINVITIDVPPLRDRLDDVPVLAEYFLKRFSDETGKSLDGFTQRALDFLASYHWPGNIRELRNVVERAVVLSKGRIIGADELTFLNPRSDPASKRASTLRELEISQIKATLESCNGNIVRASKQLGIDRSTLMRKIKRYKL